MLSLVLLSTVNSTLLLLTSHVMLTGLSRPPVVPQLHPGVGQPHPGFARLLLSV